MDDSTYSEGVSLAKKFANVFFSTINRNPKSYLFAVIGAEYVLNMLPRGTHDWRKFVKPSELAHPLRRAGFAIEQMTGVSYNPLADRWGLTRDLDVNYMVVARRLMQVA